MSWDLEFVGSLNRSSLYVKYRLEFIGVQNSLGEPFSIEEDQGGIQIARGSVRITGSRVIPQRWSVSFGGFSLQLSGDIRSILPKMRRGQIAVLRCSINRGTFRNLAIGSLDTISGQRGLFSLGFKDLLSALQTSLDTRAGTVFSDTDPPRFSLFYKVGRTTTSTGSDLGTGDTTLNLTDASFFKKAGSKGIAKCINDGVGGGVAGDDDETGLGVATPEELQELQEGLVDIQDRAEKGLSKGYINAGKTYGVSNVDLQNLSVPEKKDLIDRTIDARHAQDPTAAQLDLNARTEKGFQAENPGVVGFTNTLATALSRVSPAIAATLAVGNVINAAQGKEGIGLGGLFGLDISGKIGQELSGSLQDLVDFSETVPGNIEETIDAGVEAGKEVGSSDQEPQVPKKALPDMNDLLNKTMKIKGIDKEIPIRNSLMSQTITT